MSTAPTSLCADEQEAQRRQISPALSQLAGTLHVAPFTNPISDFVAMQRAAN